MDMLEKRSLGATGLNVTLLGFGALEIGRDWGLGGPDERRRPAEEDAARVLNAVLDYGINIIDTASAYHRSEERIGKAVSGRRREYVLASKCGEHNAEPDTYYDFSYEAIKRSIDRSLGLLKTDVIDVMQIHFGPDPEAVLRDGGCVRAMKEARADGKIRFLGASPDLEVLEACINSGDFDVLQVEYNLLNRAAGPLITKAAERGIGILIRTGLAMGLLSPRAGAVLDRDAEARRQVQPYLDLVGGDLDRLTDLAWGFLAAHPGVSSVLLGTKSVEHLKANVERARRGIDPDLVKKALEMGS